MATVRALHPGETIPEAILADYLAWMGERPALPPASAPGLVRLVLEADGDPVGVLVYQRPPDHPGVVQLLFYHALDQASGKALLDKGLPALMQSADRILARDLPADPAWDLSHWGFDRLDRLTMARDLGTFSAPSPLLPDGYLAMPLKPAHVPDLVLPALSANAGTIDNQLLPARREDVEHTLAAFAGGIAEGEPVDRAASLTMLFTGTPVGAILVRRPSSTTGFLDDIFVAPEHQGRSLGHALIVLALRALKADGAERVEVETARHLAAYHLLRRLGFTRVAERPIYFWLVTG